MANTLVVCEHAYMRAAVLQIICIIYQKVRPHMYVYTYIVNTYIYSVQYFAYLVCYCIMIALK